MGLRFRKRIRLFSGLTVNLSRSGVSTSIGTPGATLNVGGTRGARVTVGIPGTGVSYSERLDSTAEQQHGAPAQGMGFGALLMWGFAVLFVGMALYGVIAG